MNVRTLMLTSFFPPHIITSTLEVTNANVCFTLHTLSFPICVLDLLFRVFELLIVSYV